MVYFWGGGRLDHRRLVAQQRFLTYESLPETAASASDLSEPQHTPTPRSTRMFSKDEFDTEFQVAERLH
jgi:hypothetical protein